MENFLPSLNALMLVANVLRLIKIISFFRILSICTEDMSAINGFTVD